MNCSTPQHTADFENERQVAYALAGIETEAPNNYLKPMGWARIFGLLGLAFLVGFVLFSLIFG